MFTNLRSFRLLSLKQSVTKQLDCGLGSETRSISTAMCKPIDCEAPTCSQRQHDELRSILDKGMVTLAENRRTVER